jgi:hypothetical protein
MRQLVIFAAYIQVGTQSEIKVRTKIAELAAIYQNIVPEDEQIDCNVRIK